MEIVLNSWGTSLVKENGQLVVIHQDGKQIIPIDKLRTITVGKGARLSSDAALLAIENEVDILFVDDVGKPQGRVWSIQFGSITTIRRKQLDFTFSSEAIKWIKDILYQKLDNQIALLYSLAPIDWEHQSKLNKTIDTINDYKKKIKAVQGETLSDIAPSLRGWEGVASRRYYEIINLLLPEEERFDGRSQHPAMDIFNCLLNYGYGILYGKIEGELIKAGLDPYVGIMHREDYNRPVLVFDVIEKYRVWIDFVVVKLLQQKAINADCYSIRDDGSYWLEALGKRILIQSVNDYFDEVITMDGVNRSRQNHIALYSQKLATLISKAKLQES
ncbi:MAG: CRISPR-associated endonuclease Cas1 [Bacteroidales bacterium]|jgi:CRISPR-associated protein Cas1|nr:CRISPR-associated endonuclease Cas1 [Bacteroidales bacterium]MDN5351053.1 CRISP-associated protein Cas1 [Bacteroidales bacterium]